MQSNSEAARKLRQGPLARALTMRVPPLAANDNAESGASDAMLEAALRHFAAHGLGAAHAARAEAEAAFLAGDRVTSDRWLGICRLLDRRMALVAARSMEAAGRPGSA